MKCFGLLIGVALLAGSLESVTALGDETKEPEYEGKALSQWMKQSKSQSLRNRLDAIGGLRGIGVESNAAVAAIQSLLDDADSEIRLASAEALARLGKGELTVPTLIGLLQDEDQTVRKRAAEGLRNLGAIAKTAAPALKDQLSDRDAAVRLAVAEALVQMEKVKAAVPVLAELLKDENVRWEAAVTLQDLGPPAKSAASALEQLFQDEDPRVRAVAARAIATMGEAETRLAVAALTRALKDESVVDVAIDGLKEIGPEAESAVPALAELLNNESFLYGASVAEALGEIGLPAKPASPVLRKLLNDGEGSTRLTVANALVAIGEAEAAIPAFADLLKDEQNWIRHRAAEALGQIGPEAKSAVPALVELLKSDDKGDHWAAAQALERIGPGAKSAIPSLVRLLKDEDCLTRLFTAMALGRIGEAELAVPVLTDLLNEEDDGEISVPGNAFNTLSQIGPTAKSAIPALKKLLNSSDLLRRCSAAEALGRIGEPGTAIPVLRELLNSENANIRLAAAEALAKIGKAELAMPVLAGLLKDSDHWTRMYAAEALGNMGSAAKSAVPTLTESLRDREWTVRRDAAAALGEIGPGAKSAVPALTELSHDDYRDVRRFANEALKKIDRASD